MTTDMAVSLNGFLDTDFQTWAIRGGRIALILIVAFLVARIVRRLVRRLAARWADRQDRQRTDHPDMTDKRFSPLTSRFIDVLPDFETRARAAQRARTLGSTIASLCSIVIYAVAIMMCLGELQVNLAPVLAGAGVVGVALGFGAQSIVRDFLSGAFIIIEDQYGVGDIVDVGEASGVVEEVTLRSTRLRGLDGTSWHVPNGEIRRSGNKSQYWARVILDVPVAYDADLAAASMTIKRVCDDVWHDHADAEIIEEPEVWGVEDFGADSIAVRVAIKTLPGSQWAIAREVRARMKEVFDREGYEIPFPQRTVWIRDGRGK